MNLSVGIVGLPNVGKSTLFNALLKKQQALAANFPFATIEPNIGVVPVPDARLLKLAELVAQESQSAEQRITERGTGLKFPPIVPATVKFVDIAGLVKGASEGAGLGNKFLSHIREVQIIAHVVRAFEDENIIKEGSVDPKSDYQTIQTELMLADLQSISNIKNKKSRPKADQHLAEKLKQEVAEKLFKALNEGIPARDVQLSDEEREIANQLFLLSAKPEIIVLNVSEEYYTPSGIENTLTQWYRCLDNGTKSMIVICAKIESELSELSEEDQKQYLADLGLEQSGLERLITKAYETLGLISFLTAPSFAKASEGQWGKWEVRAWTLPAGWPAVRASSVIHTDFEKKFIKAEVVSFDDFVQHNGWKGAREAGKARLEGRDYIMQDGDVVEFKIGA
ncbi:MAG: redox-regulated ATPase YchF [Candidatus Levybacteria bacterium]|nr:redox-regulated ATPase YchF [Candidatus Levybacteria bacterium]